jgi:PAS domain S-box-containing protein
MAEHVTFLPDMQDEFDKLYEQVVRAKAEWQNTFDSIPDLICILDKNARIRRVNRSFSVRLRKHYETLIGAHCDEILDAPDRTPTSALFSTVLKTGYPVQGEHEVEIDGTVYVKTLYPFYDAAGNIHGAVQVLRDVTDQKRLKDKLVQSEKMAAIGTLAAEIAHDINNPLDYINNYLYLLSESLPPDFQKREYLDRIQAGIDNLAALTRDLLEFSRPPMDTFSPIAIEAVLESALELTAEGLKAKSIVIGRQFTCRDVRLMGSERMLLQVFVNLIQNAIDAMAPGGTLFISSSTSPDHCTLLFRDTGSGIPERNISRIFDPFFTTKKTATKRGTGLGLAICYNIISKHHGEISVSSKEGEGASFTITLPVGHS